MTPFSSKKLVFYFVLNQEKLAIEVEDIPKDGFLSFLLLFLTFKRVSSLQNTSKDIVLFLPMHI